MAEFYSQAFGWKTQQLGEEHGDYMLVTTSETDKDGMPKEPGRINGGFYPKKEDWPAQYPTVVVKQAVNDNCLL